jgi:hypothetical protein
MVSAGPLHDTLLELAAAMRPARDDWWVIGSAAVALLGAAPGEVADVDVLLSAGDAQRILGALGLEARPGTADLLFRSTLFARWPGPPRTVEFMSGLRVNTAAGWTPVAPRTRQAIAVGEATLFTPSRRELKDILLAFGRPKDHARAALLGD